MRIAHVCAACALLLALGPAAAAAPGPASVDRVFAIDTGKAKLVVASAPGGMVLFDGRLDVYRIYRSQPLGTKPGLRVQVVDLDGDGRPEIIGSGKPTFGLDPTGNPLWDFPEGCSDLVSGDLLATPEKEVACIHGKTLTTLSFDGSLLWEVKLSSTKMSGLAAGMLGTTDGKEGLEFNVDKEILRFKGDGTALGNEFTERLSSPPDLYREQQEANAALLAGKESIDLDGDGTAEDTLLADGAKLTLTVKGKDPVVYTFPAGPILSVALGEELQEDKPLVVVGGHGMVAFVSAEGQAVKEVPVDFARASRSPKVEAVGINAVGYNKREEVEKLVADQHGKLAACYEKRHKAYSLTRQGKTLYKFDISDKGKVTGSEVVYSTMNDPEVDGCIRKIVSGLTFPVPDEPGALVTTDLLFTWTDTFAR